MRHHRRPFALRRPVVGAILGAIALSACATRSVWVQIDPADVEMTSVTVDSRKAKGLGDGTFRAKIKKAPGEPAPVTVVATSLTGVTVTETTDAIGDEVNPITVPMPAEVLLVLESGEAETFTIDGVVYPVVKGQNVYVVPMEASTSKMANVRAIAASGAADGKEIELRPGVRTPVTLGLDLAARIGELPKSIAFGKAVSLDATASSPDSEIVSYIWSIGDRRIRQSENPKVSHRFEYVAGMNDVNESKLKLTVEAADGRTNSTLVDITLKVDREPLQVQAEIYPAVETDRLANEPVRFRILPGKNSQMKAIRVASIDFGDGSVVTRTLSGEPLAFVDDSTPILLEHTYESPGTYDLRLSYQYSTVGPQSLYAAKFGKSSEEFVPIRISPQYKSLEQLSALAWEDVGSQLSDYLSTLELDGPTAGGSAQLALTHIDDADYGQSQEQLENMSRLTTQLLQDGWYMLERQTSVLARLAPESVIDIASRIRGGENDEDFDPEAPIDYEPFLHYGLVASGGDGSAPLSFGVRVEGTEDRVLADTNSKLSAKRKEGDGEVEDEGEKNAVRGLAPAPTPRAPVGTRQLDEYSARAKRNLPVLVARFNTATVLVAVRPGETKQGVVQRGIDYSEALGEALARQSVIVDLDVRVVAREARVIGTTTLRGESSQLIAHSYLPSPAAE